MSADEPGPVTGAMRLRPAARRPEQTEAERVSAVRGARALEDLIELHRATELDAGALCRECLLPHPCRTVRLAETVAGTRTPPEEGSQ